MSGIEYCENSRQVGYDPTGESAVLCNRPGEYCSECEMVLCASCHEEVANHGVAMKKPPVPVEHAHKQRHANNH